MVGQRTVNKAGVWAPTIQPVNENYFSDFFFTTTFSYGNTVEQNRIIEKQEVLVIR